MKLITFWLVNVSALVLFSAPGIAGTISYSSSLPLSPAPWSSSITVEQFDSSLGTLDSTDLSLAVSIQGFLVVQNLTGFVNMDNTAKVTGFFWVASPDNTAGIAAAAVSAFRHYGTPVHTTGAYDYSASSQNTTNLTAPSILNQFIGTGSVSLGINSVPFALNDVNADPVHIDTALSEITVQTTYNFTAVPESGTGLLGWLALGYLILIRKKVPGVA